MTVKDKPPVTAFRGPAAELESYLRTKAAIGEATGDQIMAVLNASPAQAREIARVLRRGQRPAPPPWVGFAAEIFAAAGFFLGAVVATLLSALVGLL